MVEGACQRRRRGGPHSHTGGAAIGANGCRGARDEAGRNRPAVGSHQQSQIGGAADRPQGVAGRDRACVLADQSAHILIAAHGTGGKAVGDSPAVDSRQSADRDGAGLRYGGAGRTGQNISAEAAADQPADTATGGIQAGHCAGD